MNRTELHRQLLEDAKLFDVDNKLSADYFFDLLDKSNNEEDSEKRKERITNACLEFIKYDDEHNEWLKDLPRFDIDVDTATLLMFPANFLWKVTQGPLYHNDFFMAGLLQMLYLLNNQNAIERAFVARELYHWLNVFSDDMEAFCGVLLSLVPKLPGTNLRSFRYLQADQCLSLFSVHILRILSDFNSKYPGYISDHTEEFEDYLNANFDGDDPGEEYTSVICRAMQHVLACMLNLAAHD